MYKIDRFWRFFNYFCLLYLRKTTSMDNQNPNDKIMSSLETSECSNQALKDHETSEEHIEETVTMVDVLEQQESDEESVIAVLGGADDKKCTYSQGYLKRQPLYACKSCALKNPSKEPSGGICLACSYKCHEGHDLVELYTKRNFRCDCGNNRFPGNMCMLEMIRDDENELNSYNQNFEGLYCICHRPYPDPENQNEDQMLQCAVCEDWFHSLHLNSKMPPPDEFDEMICQLCIKKFPFLICYQLNTFTEGQCKVKDFKPPEQIGAIFLKSTWRSSLCVCEACRDIYKKEKIEFLLDVNETPYAYEKENKEKARASSHRMEMEALSSLDRVQQIEAIQNYNHMKDKLKEFLQTFATTGRVVQADDIANFFTKMKAKRMKMDPTYVPPTCR